MSNFTDIHNHCEANTTTNPLQTFPLYKATFFFIACYYLISHGRLHLLIPVLAKIPTAMIAGILAVVSFLVEKKKDHDTWQLSREEKLLAGLAVMCIVTLPTSLWMGNSVTGFMKGLFPAMILSFIAAFICKSWRDIEKFVWVYIINCFFVIWMALSANIDHYSIRVTDMYDVNDIAMVLVTSLPIAFYLMKQQQGVRKIILLLYLALALITIIKTGSRGGVLGLAGMVLYMVMQSKSKIKTLIITALAMLAIFTFSPEESKERFATMIKPQTEYDQNYGDRKQIWKRGVQIVLGSPLLGAGLGNYGIADGNVKEIGQWKTAHNSYLQIAVELGVIGFILFVMLTVGTFFKIRNARLALDDMQSPSPLAWIVKGIELFMVSFIITAFFLSQAYNPQLYFIIAMVIAAQKMLAVNLADLHRVEG